MIQRTDLLPLRLLLLSALGLPACGDKDEDDDGGTTDSGTSPAGCVGEEAILDAGGAPTGYVRCADGSIDRVDTRAWDPTIAEPRCTGEEVDRACEVDEDCTAGPHGACIQVNYKGGFADACGCVYACATDADCGTGELCIGEGVREGIVKWSQCVEASCAVADDCASGECGLSAWDDGCGWRIELACRSDADECRADGDCPETPCGVGYSDDHYACQDVTCTPGRPLRVEGQARTAPLVAAGGWGEALAPAVPASRRARRALAAWWAEVGALEHASVASFARFSLELMALGAPPELLLQAQQAGADEVAHARLAWGLASAYAGRPVGPGPLSMRGVAVADRAEAILVALIEEACVNETLAAAEAGEAARRCADPVVRQVLLRIARDEARHAALGWRCLAWLLQQRPDLAPLAGQTLDRLQAELVARSPAHGPDLAELGLPSPAARHAVHVAAMAEVVAPCAAALAA